MNANPTSMFSINQLVPTHRCKVCGAFWRFFRAEENQMPTDSWNLRSPTCGVCCDSTEMRDQVEPVTFGQLLASESALLELSKLVNASDLGLRLKKLIDSPEIERFLDGTRKEAVHQVERWGDASDRAKRPADWFWLIGYLAGKALHAAVAGDADKARHHCISTSAALYNWHCAISGISVHMSPGLSDVAQIVEANFPGEGR